MEEHQAKVDKLTEIEEESKNKLVEIRSAISMQAQLSENQRKIIENANNFTSDYSEKVKLAQNTNADLQSNMENGEHENDEYLQSNYFWLILALNTSLREKREKLLEIEKERKCYEIAFGIKAGRRESIERMFN